jgi:hypothetical protein
MQPADEFVKSVDALFKKRRLYRIASIVCLIITIFGYSLWIMYPFLIQVFYFGAKLINTEMNLERKIWQKFSECLDSVPDSMTDINSKPLEGVMGTIGDVRDIRVLVAGTYDTHKVRLLQETVYYNPSSENGNYSRKYRILEIQCPQDFYNVFVDSKSNNQSSFSTAMNVLSRSVRSNPKLTVEGDVNKFFDIYVPKDSKADSLITLTPEKLLALREYGTKFDVEFINNSVYLISNAKIKNVKDIMAYQKDILKVIDNIGIDLKRQRKGTEDQLVIKTPVILTLT